MWKNLPKDYLDTYFYFDAKKCATPWLRKVEKWNQRSRGSLCPMRVDCVGNSEIIKVSMLGR